MVSKLGLGQGCPRPDELGDRPSVLPAAVRSEKLGKARRLNSQRSSESGRSSSSCLVRLCGPAPDVGRRASVLGRTSMVTAAQCAMVCVGLRFSTKSLARRLRLRPLARRAASASGVTGVYVR